MLLVSYDHVKSITVAHPALFLLQESKNREREREWKLMLFLCVRITGLELQICSFKGMFASS